MRYWSVLGGSGSVEGGTCCNWWYCVSVSVRNWLVRDNTESGEGDTSQYLVALDQYGAVLVGTWWY